MILQTAHGSFDSDVPVGEVGLVGHDSDVGWGVAHQFCEFLLHQRHLVSSSLERSEEGGRGRVVE